MTVAETNPFKPHRHDGSPLNAEGNHEYVLAGCLTVDDALSSHRLATRGYWPRISLAVLVITTFSIVLIAIAVSSRPYSAGASNVMLLVACLIFPALLLVPMVVLRLRLYRFARRQFGMFAPTYTTFSPSKIVATSENSRSELQWSLFSHCVANEIVALVFFKNSKNYMILARKKLKDPAQWNSFVSMVQHQLAMSESPKG